jgi:glutamate carboxypeptidase
MPDSPWDAYQDLLPVMVEQLRELVEIESPTTDKKSVDRLADYVSTSMASMGAKITRYPQSTTGDHILGEWGAERGGILLLTHLDTVHPIGTLENFQWHLDGDRIYGPGILDMKASISMALGALRTLMQANRLPSRRISLLCTSDEETGSHSSRSLIQELAHSHELVLCLEPALPDGALKTWRKGVGLFNIRVEGKAAHAGANPGDGINAIVEMAHQLPKIVALQDEEGGTTLNIGRIQGGTRSNVVPSSCSIKVDVRVLSEAEQERVRAGLEALSPYSHGAKLIVRGDWNRPPMPRTPLMVETFKRAQSIAAEIGIQIDEGGTGGASDANFVAPLEVPVLDGLGAIGSGAHTHQEYILFSKLAERTALLGALLHSW